MPILNRSQRDAEAVSELGLFEIILGTDALDTKLLGIAYSVICYCFHDVLPFKWWAGCPALGGCLLAVLSRLRRELKEANGVLDVGAVVTTIIQLNEVLAEDAVQTVGLNQILDCLLGFFVGFHVVLPFYFEGVAPRGSGGA